MPVRGNLLNKVYVHCRRPVPSVRDMQHRYGSRAEFRPLQERHFRIFVCFYFKHAKQKIYASQLKNATHRIQDNDNA